MAKSADRRHKRAPGGRPGQFRIIGGEWRSRRLAVPALEDVRPTPDRVRETVFNWLAPVIAGARCLDLYAGSGALGLEALSRGAGEVIFVDQAPAALRQLAANLELLRCDRGRTVRMDAAGYLEGPATRFDVVFLDPPYRRGMLAPALARLVARGWVGAASVVYLEHEAGAAPPALPPGWVLARSAAAGQVRYHLARFEPHTAGET
ncbi:16S rRNA (guanine(966)-N(2))-methyltransferase RsmD [Thioalkalivibrio sp. XN279]|uniref:16S rRNA (guanine(966)-N(2))-methyltransferase RsmD n=1 Tax=Thioalkalivibrio sp. XN279 TaxID=2714953 RepID=UPI00140CC669|nr:16S rRNA (guanine(966)-N(2))-methyltransferase RsmD [Thioalkalivibrio sp. XN279]NHA15684.1 16S rRNA (guanine(966)-N(2))-methyltransferase RsmD [Thioalkalivibrio sp. XN279]